MSGIKDIAKKAGVSIGTVDRVLHNRGRFATETQDKVLAAARELDYQPNLNARRLKHKEPCRILVMMAELKQDQGYWEVCLKGIQQAQSELKSIGVEVILRTYNRYSQDSFFKAAAELEQKEYRGVLLAPLRPDDSKVLMSNYADLPFVIFDCPLSDAQPWRSVLQDPYVAGKTSAKLMSCMVSKNQATAVISYASPNPHQDLRAKGYIEVMQGLGHQCPDHFVISHELTLQQLESELLKKKYELHNYAALFITKTSVHQYAEILSNYNQRPYVIGYDLIQQNVDALKQGKIDFLISQDSSSQTYQGIKCLSNFLLDGQVQQGASMSMPVDILNSENIDLYLENH
jgi:LacI family transcriptional regulator